MKFLQVAFAFPWYIKVSMADRIKVLDVHMTDPDLMLGQQIDSWPTAEVIPEHRLICKGVRTVGYNFLDPLPPKIPQLNE